MEEDYDVIVLGTGLKECILSGLLSVSKSKVLHMDRNNYYGADSASLNLEQLWKKFHPDEKEAKIPANFGRSRDYNVDLCPKFIMACGNLVKMLLHTKVTRYLQFQVVDGSYVVKDGVPQKVPATPTEALASDLMGFFQKRKFKNFISYVNELDPADQKTWDGLDPKVKTSQEVFTYWGLDENTVAFTGHALALHLDDAYLNQPFLETAERIKMYAYSVARYGKSPYIYPVYGLGGLPEGFSRLSAVYGGVYMLNRPIDEILYNDDGTVKGVKSQGEVARCKKLLADPSYFIGTDKVKKVGQVARAICLLNHPIKNLGNNTQSAQIIIPASQTGRKSDIYVSIVSSEHQVVPQGKFLATVSCNVETKDPHSELLPGLKLLENAEKEFFYVADLYAPTGDGTKDNIYITTSYDATSHFESATEEIPVIFKGITGNDVEMAKTADPEDLQNTD